MRPSILWWLVYEHNAPAAAESVLMNHDQTRLVETCLGRQRQARHMTRVMRIGFRLNLVDSLPSDHFSPRRCVLRLSALTLTSGLSDRTNTERLSEAGKTELIIHGAEA